MIHKAGYVNIIGRPNVGKSTLLNQWLGEKLSIVTPKAQTTRKRILGIWNDEYHQIVLSDTPGIIFNPTNQLHIMMNKAVEDALEDADILIYVTEPAENPDILQPVVDQLKHLRIHKLLLINKCDTLHVPEAAHVLVQSWESLQLFEKIFKVSALWGIGTAEVLQYILSILPEHPPYFPKDQLSDRTERFFVADIIREKILLLYEKEIPYAVEVVIENFKEEETITKIKAVIYAERESQKAILIGKNGNAIKNLGVAAREDIEHFLGKKVFLELHVKVKEKWRNDINALKKLGYG